MSEIDHEEQLVDFEDRNVLQEHCLEDMKCSM